MTDEHKGSSLLGLGFGFLAVVLWGLSFVATKFVLTEISPMAIVFVRTLLGTAVLVAIALLRGHSLRVPRSNCLSLCVAGALGVFLHQLLQAHALTLTTAVRTGWLIGVIPIWSTILALLFLGERLWLFKCSGLAIGFCGVLLLITGGGLDGLLLPRTAGDLLILASTLNWAIYTVLGRRVVECVNPIVATTLIFLCRSGLAAAVGARCRCVAGVWRSLGVGDWVDLVSRRWLLGNCLSAVVRSAQKSVDIFSGVSSIPGTTGDADGGNHAALRRRYRRHDLRGVAGSDRRLPRAAAESRCLATRAQNKRVVFGAAFDEIGGLSTGPIGGSGGGIAPLE